MIGRNAKYTKRGGETEAVMDADLANQVGWNYEPPSVAIGKYQELNLSYPFPKHEQTQFVRVLL